MLALIGCLAALGALCPQQAWWAVPILVVLVGWQGRSGDVLRALLHSRPLDHPAVVARLEQIVSTTSLPMPRFEQIDLHGGVVANAVALPSLRRSTVLFSETLVDRFDADEIVAIGAHELAHFEFYTRRRLTWMRVVSLAMVGLAAGVPVAIHDLGLQVSWYWFGLGALPLFLVLASTGRHRQRHETGSDQRAVQLTGDPDALVRALTKLHVIARHPRRWDPKLEQQATHPSLARRIQAIRALQPAAEAPAFEPATFVAPGGTSSVTLDTREIVWRETPASAHTLGYAISNSCAS